MIFTVGKREIYEPYIEQDEHACKAAGGSVWKEILDVKNYLHKNPMPDFDIYGVEADWLTDTKIDINGSGWHELLHKARLIKL